MFLVGHGLMSGQPPRPRPWLKRKRIPRRGFPLIVVFLFAKACYFVSGHFPRAGPRFDSADIIFLSLKHRCLSRSLFFSQAQLRFFVRNSDNMNFSALLIATCAAMVAAVPFTPLKLPLVGPDRDAPNVPHITSVDTD